MTPEARQALVAFQLQVERRDGPRYVEAVWWARLMRERAFRHMAEKWGRVDGARYSYPLERAIRGIPEGWITR